MSASVNGIRGGQPSTTQPIAGPWLSPKVVTRNRWPNVLKDMTPPQPNSSNARVYQAVVSRAFWRVKLDCASQASGTFGSLAQLGMVSCSFERVRRADKGSLRSYDIHLAERGLMAS